MAARLPAQGVSDHAVRLPSPSARTARSAIFRTTSSVTPSSACTLANFVPWAMPRCKRAIRRPSLGSTTWTSKQRPKPSGFLASCRHGRSHRLSFPKGGGSPSDPGSHSRSAFLDSIVSNEHFADMSTKQLTAEALALPLADKVSLAQALWQSIDSGLADSDEQMAIREAIRRDQELPSGAVQGLSPGLRTVASSSPSRRATSNSATSPVIPSGFPVISL